MEIKIQSIHFDATEKLEACEAGHGPEQGGQSLCDSARKHPFCGEDY